MGTQSGNHTHKLQIERVLPIVELQTNPQICSPKRSPLLHDPD